MGERGACLAASLSAACFHPGESTLLKTDLARWEGWAELRLGTLVLTFWRLANVRNQCLCLTSYPIPPNTQKHTLARYSCRACTRTGWQADVTGGTHLHGTDRSSGGKPPACEFYQKLLARPGGETRAKESHAAFKPASKEKEPNECFMNTHRNLQNTYRSRRDLNLHT